MTPWSKIFVFVSVFVVLILGAAVMPALAQVDVTTNTTTVGETAGLSGENPFIIIGRILQWLFGLLGVVLVLIIIYAGWLYMTAGGDPEATKKAKAWIINAVIGLVIILASFSIVSFIMSRLQQAITGEGMGGESAGGYVTPGLGSGAFGTIIQEHFPGVGMVVPRNTVVMVTFKEPMDPLSVLKDGVCQTTAGVACTATGSIGQDCVCRGKLNTEAIQLYKACDSIYPAGSNSPEQYSEANRANPLICNSWTGDAPTDPMFFVSEGDVVVTPDFKTVVFNPYGTDVTKHLGSATNDVGYFVKLTNNISRLDNKGGMFASTKEKSYTWDFTTNTTIDVTPPFVTGVYPVTLDDKGQPLPADNPDAKKFVRNTRLRVDFSEPVLPPVYLTQNPSVNQPGAEMEIMVGGTPVAGSYVAGINQYRSIVFKPSGSCGEGVALTNSCGESVFCLPANATIKTTAHSVPTSQLMGAGPGASFYPAGGIVDAALNALDSDGRLGQGDGKTTGTTDDFSWTFMTSADVDLNPPVISSLPSPVDVNAAGVTPAVGSDTTSGVGSQAIVSAFFSESIDPSTATNKSVSIVSDRWDSWYSGSLLCPAQQAADGSIFCKTNDRVVVINHGPFPAPKDTLDIPLFFPKMMSTVQDMAGNCFNPSKGPGCENLKPGQACCAKFDGSVVTMEAQVDKSGNVVDTCPY